MKKVKHRKGGGEKGGLGAKGQDNEGDDHPINRARAAIDLRAPVTIKHQNGERTEISLEFAHQIVDLYRSFRLPADKEEMIDHINKSRRHMVAYIAGDKIIDRKGPWRPGDPIPDHLKI